MKKFLIASLALATMLLSGMDESNAGSRSFSSGSRSFSRSYSAPRAPAIRTAPRVTPPTPTITNNKTIIRETHTTHHTESGGGGGSGLNNMLLGGTIGYLIGNSGHNQQPPQQVVVQQPAAAPVAAGEAPAQTQQYLSQAPAEESHLWLIFFISVVVVSFVFILWYIFKKD